MKSNLVIDNSQMQKKQITFGLNNQQSPRNSKAQTGKYENPFYENSIMESTKEQQSHKRTKTQDGNRTKITRASL